MHLQSLSQRRHKMTGSSCGLVGIWADRALARRALATYDETMLEDLGLTSAARARECRKPFWKA